MARLQLSPRSLVVEGADPAGEVCGLPAERLAGVQAVNSGKHRFDHRFTRSASQMSSSIRLLRPWPDGEFEV